LFSLLLFNNKGDFFISKDILNENSECKSTLILLKHILTGSSIDIFNDGYNYTQYLEGNIHSSCSTTMIGIKRLEQFHNSVEFINKHNVNGVIAEFGVWRGGAMLYVKHMLDCYNIDKELHLFDVFGSMDDYSVLKNFISISEEKVKYLFDISNKSNGVFFHKSIFENITKETWDSIKEYSIVRIDGNFYSSYKVVLENTWNKLNKNGILILDDYDHCLDCRRAWEEHLKQYNLTYQPIKIDMHSVYFVKSEEIYKKQKNKNK